MPSVRLAAYWAYVAAVRARIIGPLPDCLAGIVAEYARIDEVTHLRQVLDAGVNAACGNKCIFVRWHPSLGIYANECPGSYSWIMPHGAYDSERELAGFDHRPCLEDAIAQLPGLRALVSSQHERDDVAATVANGIYASYTAAATKLIV